MMFYDFIVIIIALLIYSSAPLGEVFKYPVYINAAALASLYILYGTIVSLAFRRDGSAHENRVTYRVRNRFAVTQKKMTTLALFLYAVMLYLLDIKRIINQLPSETIQKCAAIFLFFLFLIFLWYFSFTSNGDRGVMRRERSRHVNGMFRLNLAVIIPWILASLVIDISSLFPDSWILFVENTEWVQVLLFPVFLFFIAVFAPVIILKVWGCTTIQNPDFIELVNGACARAKVKVRKVVLWSLIEPHAVTAGVMGIINRFRYILLTPTLIRMLSREEMESVLAHELGHAKHHHLSYNLVLFLCFGIFSFIYPDLFMLIILHTGLVKNFPTMFANSGSPVFNLFFWGGMILSLLLFFRYIFGFFSRNFERQADNFALTLTGKSQPLKSALTRVAVINGMDVHAPNWHHFGIKERIDSLKAAEAAPVLIEIHGRRVLRLKLLCAFTMIFLLTLATFSILKTPGEKIKRQFVEGQINLMIEKEMNNPELHLLRAQLKTEEKEYRAGIAAYKKVLSLAPDNVTALNNLAWLYVTAEERVLRNPAIGLRLALKAVSLSKKAYVLDTLAECYFANGEFDKAIAAERAALSIEKKDRSHYLKQIKRYEQAKSALKSEK